MIELPLSGVEVSLWALLLIGFTAGVCGAFFGLGGAFIVTPGLHILGLPIVYAVGTGIAYVVGHAIVAAGKHARLGNVDAKLGLIMLVSTLPAVEVGKRTIMHLEGAGLAGPVVRGIYIALLMGISLYIGYEQLRGESQRKRKGARMAAGGSRPWAISAKPMVTLSHSRLARISLWQLLPIGVATGFVAGFLGIAGGLLMVPALIYLVGFSAAMAAGTSLFLACFISAYGGLSYALEAKVELAAAMAPLLGAVPGIQLGALATGFVSGTRWRLYFAATVLLIGISLALKQLALWQASPLLQDLSAWLVLGAAGGMSLLIISLALMGLASQGKTAKGKPLPDR
ncbi:MAG: sulfite exporter TauE/SafE family protein [Dehalococcoidia bacterium]